MITTTERVSDMQDEGRSVRTLELERERRKSLKEKVNSFVNQAKEIGLKNCVLIERVKNSNGEETCKHRFFIKNDAICVFRKGSSRRGYYYEPNLSTLDVNLHVIKRKDETNKWEKSWTKVVKMLEESGLWEDLLNEIKDGLAVGLSKIQKAYDISMDYSKREVTSEMKTSQIKEIDERLLNSEGTYFNTSIVWNMSYPARVKKMYFGKYFSKDKLNEIQQALKKKDSFSTSGRSSYDVSFSYNPDANKAWYSEEYKGCGNGHYYLALNSTHALFCEDD